VEPEQPGGMWVGLADAVNGVRAELEIAQEKAASSRLQFEVGSIELELAVDVRQDRASSMGVDVRVLSLSRSKQLGLSEAHRLKIVLHPKERGGQVPAKISDDLPGLPPR
jgi:NTP-dependent ternary system trypsin peptidase co-occuring protein